jgi:hypothetical protein
MRQGQDGGLLDIFFRDLRPPGIGGKRQSSLVDHQIAAQAVHASRGAQLGDGAPETLV